MRSKKCAHAILFIRKKMRIIRKNGSFGIAQPTGNNSQRDPLFDEVGRATVPELMDLDGREASQFGVFLGFSSNHDLSHDDRVPSPREKEVVWPPVGGQKFRNPGN